MTYAEADAKLRRNGKPIERRKVENNTYLERRGEAIALRLHDTDVVTFRADGAVSLNTGGWYTVTTKDRINKFLWEFGIQVRSKNKQWFLFNGTGKIGKFADGLVIHANGEITGIYPGNDADEYNAGIEKKIRKYLDGLTVDVLRGLDRDVRGDCWYCAFTTVEDGKGLGDSFKDYSHLLDHLDERYYMVSLLFRALEAAKFAHPDFIIGDCLNRPEVWLTEIRRRVGQYLRNRLYHGPRDGRRGDL